MRIKPSHVLSSSLYYELALSDLQFIQNYNKDNNLAIKPSTFENLIWLMDEKAGKVIISFKEAEKFISEAKLGLIEKELKSSSGTKSEKTEKQIQEDFYNFWKK